jgi:ribose 1,5-bisphosphokinase
MMIACGTLALIVGPSGVGKDSLIARARIHLADDRRFRFQSRFITRPPGAGPERHVPLTRQAFETAESQGAFLLSWRAHDTAYAIPVAVVDDLARGRVVIANVSRGVVGLAASRVRSTAIIHVTAPPEILSDRLAARNRESGDEITQRLARTQTLPPSGAPVYEVDNSGPFDEASNRFIAILLGLAERRTNNDE